LEEVFDAMTVVNSNISWCTGTLNLTVGCTKISAACDHCYAERLVNRALWGNGDFATLQYHPDRLRDLRKFLPALGGDGKVFPKMIFVNSLSDFWHEAIPLDFVHRALDEFERHPTIIFQILTKRPGRMRRVITDRYRAAVPAHFWIGVTCEDNRVKRGLDILRDTKDQVGEFTAFTSIEPITAPCDQIDLTGIDWVLTGGESGPFARLMEFEWLEQANEKALAAGIALHFKQYGHPRNNPLVQQALRDGMKIKAAFAHVCSGGQELAPHEKGGATYKGRVYHQKPPHWTLLKAGLNAS
jgi:protein gp37